MGEGSEFAEAGACAEGQNGDARQQQPADAAADDQAAEEDVGNS